MMDQRFSDNDTSRRDIPSFIEPRPPLINNPFMRPRPQKGTNLLEQFEEDSEIEEPELVQVYLRMKPHDAPNNLYEVRSDKCLVTSLDTTTAGHGRRTQHNVSRMYTFSRIFNDRCSQKEIFEQVVKDNLKKLPDGHSFTLLAYGASGSGKTYTLMGTVNSPGLIPRSLEYVFKLVDASPAPLYKPSDGGADTLAYHQQEFELQWVKRLRQVSAPQRDKYRRMSAQLKNDMTVSTFDLTNRTKYYVWVSFVEIYNEAIYDLLAPPDKRAKLRIREDTTGQVYVKGVTQAFVRTGVEAYDVMVAGKHNLVVAATGVHAQSSRSHCIFTITMLTETDGEIRTSCIRLCDLAGCERARATRNTGARMQESRAINSSLHVLERCLHMLRRNQKQRQEALVPYRESKLTRLLGSGLSGSRGEAVSMVVTLNPAPQYAHETKHVLSLAAVAQDIQINNTAMFTTTLESSTQDTTITSTAEVMRLRADNERLHFELFQAHARNKELQAEMEEKQEQTARTMSEMVAEAKDLTRQYYETNMHALKTEMQEMIEQYEVRLAKIAVQPATGQETPTSFLQDKVADLMTEIAVLEDKLSTEQLSRARAEEEVKHLRTCIDERDEKAYKEIEPEPEEMVLTDSDDENSDPFNQSLEPVFRKECMDRSKVIKNDIVNKTTLNYNDEYNDDKDNTVVEVESDIDKSTDTIKQDDNGDADDDDTANNSDYATGDESDDKDASVHFTHTANNKDDDLNITHDDKSKIVDQSYIAPKNMNEYEDSNISGYFEPDLEQDKGPNESIEVKSNVRVACFDEEIEENVKLPEPEKARGTYFVRKSAIDVSSDEEMETELTEPAIPRETYFVRTSAIDTSIDEEMQEVVEHKAVLPIEEVKETPNKEFIKPKIVSEMLVNKILKSLKKSTHSNVSDSSLRQFEQLEIASEKCKDDLSDRNSTFGEIKILKEKRTYFDENVKVVSETFISSNKTKDSLKNREENIEDELHVTAKTNTSETFISSNQTNNSIENRDKTEILTNAVHNLQKNTNDEESKTNPDQILIPKLDTEKRTYFDNIEISCENIPNRMVADIITSARKNHERSPSIVSDDTDKPLEPSTMKKLLGENIAKLEVLSSINKVFVKKHESMDVFEGLESPLAKDKQTPIASPIKTNNCSNVDEVRKSIEKLVLKQKTRNDKLESISSVEEQPETQNRTVKNTDNSVPKVTISKINDTTIELNNTQPKQDNTIEEFENIYKDLSTQRPTDFDLLAVSTQEIHEIELTQTDLQKKSDKEETPEQKEVKYNLRNKGKSVGKSVLTVSKDIDKDEVLLENTAKCESKKYNKRSLRLRRRRNDEDNSDNDNEKLKDILNLKKEFSDVTLGLPAFKKEVKDIPSPEKLPGEENLPPMMGIQSCPSKSVLRSRRKLFTPRAEPLEESLSQTGDSNERIYVPRPSYHRSRARRKL